MPEVKDEWWELFGKAIELYQTKKVTREDFCKIWHMAQQLNYLNQLCVEQGV